MLYVLLVLNRTTIPIRQAREFGVTLMGCSHTYFVLMGLSFDLLPTLPLGSELCFLIANKRWERMTRVVAKASSPVTQLTIYCKSFNEPIKIHLKFNFSDSTIPNYLSQQL